MNNLRKQTNIKKIVLISILVSISVIFSIFDRFISSVAFPFLPTAKIGLANIVILIGVYKFNFKETFLMVVLKSLLTGLILGFLISFIISIVASTISFFGMYLGHKFLRKVASPISISVIGGFLHIIGQLLVVSILYVDLGDTVLYYGAILIFVSLITSVIIGFITIRLLDNFNLEQNFNKI